MTAAGVLGSISATSALADSTASPSLPSPQAAAITQCLVARHQATGASTISMADVAACVPGAQQLAAGAAITAAGAYFTPTARGVDISLMQVSALPSQAAGDGCNYYGYTNWDYDLGAETLAATMCFNDSIAWAYNLSTTCTTFPPYSMTCEYANDGIVGNDTSTVNPWSNWFNTYGYGTCPGERELRMWLTRSGSWSEHSYNAGC